MRQDTRTNIGLAGVVLFLLGACGGAHDADESLEDVAEAVSVGAEAEGALETIEYDFDTDEGSVSDDADLTEDDGFSLRPEDETPETSIGNMGD